MATAIRLRPPEYLCGRGCPRRERPRRQTAARYFATERGEIPAEQLDLTTSSRVRNGDAQKIESYGARFTQVITAFLNEHGGDTATAEAFFRHDSRHHNSSSGKKKKLPFYIARKNLMRWN